MINSMAKHKYVLYMTLIAMLWDVVSGYLLYLCYPEHYLTFYPVIPIYFYRSEEHTSELQSHSEI